MMAIAVVSVVGYGAWVTTSRSPEAILIRYSFKERKGEEGEQNGKAMQDELIACGELAIPVMIREIREGWWSRGRAYFPFVLKGLGNPAKEALLTAIDNESEAIARMHLIGALQVAFTNYSRLDLVLSDANNGVLNESLVRRFAARLRGEFPSAPAPEVDSKLNPEFVSWWNANKAQIQRQ